MSVLRSSLCDMPQLGNIPCGSRDPMRFVAALSMVVSWPQFDLPSTRSVTHMASHVETSEQVMLLYARASIAEANAQMMTGDRQMAMTSISIPKSLREMMSRLMYFFMMLLFLRKFFSVFRGCSRSSHTQSSYPPCHGSTHTHGSSSPHGSSLRSSRSAPLPSCIPQCHRRSPSIFAAPLSS